MNLTIRRPTLRDATIIAEHNCRLAHESEGKTLDPTAALAGVEAAIADPDCKGAYFLAFDGDEPVGQCQVTREWSDWRNGWFWWFQSVYVRRNHRGRGVFRSLYEHVKQSARNEGNVLSLRLYVDRDNHGARAVYERLGMRVEHYDLMHETLSSNFSP